MLYTVTYNDGTQLEIKPKDKEFIAASRAYKNLDYAPSAIVIPSSGTTKTAASRNKSFNLVRFGVSEEFSREENVHQFKTILKMILSGDLIKEANRWISKKVIVKISRSGDEPILHAHSLNKNTLQYRLGGFHDVKDPVVYLNSQMDNIWKIICDEMDNKSGIKLSLKNHIYFLQ
jgi:hypothetical protein